ncbi:hypothetical protein TNCV_2355441 [Trichonephila clavipes]|nr:hypothetical protein TNCV_2355441 [Trichonephila clavipes]
MNIPIRLIERNLRSYRSLRHLPFMAVHSGPRLQWCLNRSGWNHAEWGRIVFLAMNPTSMCPDDNRRRRPCRSYFHIARPKGPQQGIMVWGAISF